MTWPELIDAFSEYIPGYGILYSFNRMVHAGRTGDGRAELKSAINLAQGVVRDAVLFSGVDVAAPIAVCMAIGDSVTDKIAYLWKSGQEPRISHESSRRLPKGKDHVHLLILGKEQACKDTLQRYKGYKEF